LLLIGLPMRLELLSQLLIFLAQGSDRRAPISPVNQPLDDPTQDQSDKKSNENILHMPHLLTMLVVTLCVCTFTFTTIAHFLHNRQQTFVAQKVTGSVLASIVEESPGQRKPSRQVADSAGGGHNERMSKWIPYLEFATSLAVECSEYAVSQLRLHPPQRKRDGTLVTETDIAIDRMISHRLAATFPDHRVLSEEQITAYDAGAEFTWVIDPIDGTTNFARGLPIWGVSVALLHDGQPVAGVVDFPLMQERFTAAAGAGAWRSGEPIQTYDGETADDQQLLMKCTRTGKRLQMRTKLKSRICGSAAYHLCKVADGTALIGVEATPKVWDLAAAWLIVVEAGGVITTWQQEPIFPLAAVSKEYVAAATPVFAAANPAIMREFVAGLTITGIS
jgi:myo-inositol-1(or 4)-monophosphatase